MDESTLRSLIQKAIGDADLPGYVRDQTRTSVRLAARSAAARHRLIPALGAVLLAVTIVAVFLGSSTPRGNLNAVGGPATSSSCAASALSVTGTKGERLYPRQLPPGFVLYQGHEDDLGSMGDLTYTIPGGGDQPRIVLLRYFTNEPVDRLFGGPERHAVTVQGHPAVVVGGPPSPEYIWVGWLARAGVVLSVGGYKIPETQVLAVANQVNYESGVEFVYPGQPRVTVMRQQALAKLPGSATSKHAVLTSFGEIDAVTHPIETLNHVPSLAPAVEVVRPVWVVWSVDSNAGPIGSRSAIIIDASSAEQIAQVPAVNPLALSSLTDRSQTACAPPFGVLTRTEITFLYPGMLGDTSTVKLMTLGMLRSIKEGSDIGNCRLAKCDPNVPLWVWIQTAKDCSLLLRCSPPPSFASPSPLPTPSPGTWSVSPFDARTGPQNTSLGGAGGRGLPPADVTNLPDLAAKS